MPLVNVMVNARAYTIACDDGEEDHLKRLAAYVDAKVRELMESVGQVGDTRLLLMAALLLADECFEAQSQLEAHGKRVAEAANDHLPADNLAAERLEAAAKQLEDIAARFARA